MYNIGVILLFMFAVSLLATVIGFKKYVWFLSIGYGFAVLGIGVVLAILGIVGLDGVKFINITSLIVCILFVVYGFRLGGFLLIRELKNKDYQKTLQDATKTKKPIPTFVLVTMWVLVCVLYVCQTAGVAFVMFNRGPVEFFSIHNAFEIIGPVVMLGGILLEALSDKQKSDQKKENPKAPAMKGLFKICRCPNYCGEILFWTGVLLYTFTTVVEKQGSLAMANTWWQWLIVAFGYVCIVYIMFNGAKRLELRQEKSYGNNPEYKSYMEKTPIILYLGIPVKSLKNSKIVK